MKGNRCQLLWETLYLVILLAGMQDLILHILADPFVFPEAWRRHPYSAVGGIPKIYALGVEKKSLTGSEKSSRLVLVL